MAQISVSVCVCVSLARTVNKHHISMVLASPTSVRLSHYLTLVAVTLILRPLHDRERLISNIERDRER